MQVVYLAGPYRSKDGAWGVRQNVEAATRVARELWMAGFAVICPHANTSFMDGPNGGTDDLFISGDLELVRRCDLVITVPGYQKSAGAIGEVREALNREIPVFHWPQDTPELLAEAKKESTFWKTVTTPVSEERG